MIESTRVLRLPAPPDIVQDLVLLSRNIDHDMACSVPIQLSARSTSSLLLNKPRVCRLEEYVLGRRLVLHTTYASIEATEEFDLEPAAGATVVRLTARWHLTGPLRVAQPLLRLPVLHQTSASAHRLRRAIAAREP